MEGNSFDLAAMDAALAATPFQGKLQHFSSIGSTNTHAMQQGLEGAASGSVYFADEQTAGRGRGGHSWHSAPGSGLYVSVLLRPQISPSDALWLSLAAGLAVHEAVASVTGLQPDLRWPNDLLLGKKKFCGILLEMQADAMRVRHAVIGIGINVQHASFPAELQPLATSLRIETGREWSRQALLVELLKALHRETTKLMQSETVEEAAREIPSRLKKISTWIMGKDVVVGDPAEFSGVTIGLDAKGFLKVQTSAGIRTVLTGGVRELQL